MCFKREYLSLYGTNQKEGRDLCRGMPEEETNFQEESLAGLCNIGLISRLMGREKSKPNYTHIGFGPNK